MLGLSRHELQRMIHDGELESFDGQVELERLRERFPTASLAESAFSRELQYLKKTAFALRIKDVAMPEAEILATQVHRLRAKLAVSQAREDHYRELLVELGRRLSALYSDCDESHRERLMVLNRWLLGELDK